MNDTNLDILLSNPLKVISVDAGNESFYCRLQDGRAARIRGLPNPLPEFGDIILLDEEGWEKMPDSMWPVVNATAIVRQVLSDGTVLLDDGIYIKPVLNPRRLDVRSNNTIEYDNEGIIRVICDTPIRCQRQDFGDVDVARDYLVKKLDIDLSFDDFGGYPEVIRRARELIETQFMRRDHLDKIGARPVRGILFTGPPGTGKTHLARIIAQQSNADFYLVSGPAIISKWMGDTEDTLRKIFEAAAASQSGRAIIFFDEIDSIAERRTGESHEMSKRLVAQLLTLMDGFESKGRDVVFIAATNRVETLDPALMRPGRFDWEIKFGLPSHEDRVRILEVGAKKLSTEPKLPLDEIAKASENWSAAELTSLWAEAALVAAGDSRDRIAAEDIAQAYERVASRPRRTTKPLDTA